MIKSYCAGDEETANRKRSNMVLYPSTLMKRKRLNNNSNNNEMVVNDRHGFYLPFEVLTCVST